MKRTIILLLAGIVAAACGDYPTNGDLDGMWHLRTTESMADNRIEDVKEERIYYSVAQNLISLHKVDSSVKRYIGRFDHTGDSLILHSFVAYQNESKPAPVAELLEYKLEGEVSRYAVRKLDSKQLVLRSADTELTFKKF